MRTTRRPLVALGALVVAAVLAPAASASISPALTLDQSAGTQAGSSPALTTDIKFAPTAPTTDSVKNLTEILPPGLLSDASIDGGVCIKTAPPSKGFPAKACKIGTGMASVVANGTFSTTVPLSLYLVAPPQPSDLAGIAIYNDNTVAELGDTGDVSVRPSGDPAGVGIDISFTNIPDSLSFGGPAVSLSIQELDTTINAMRMPDSCPSPAAKYKVIADSYSDSTTEKTTTAPLKVTGCSSLTLTPTFTVGAVRDTSDAGVQVTTDIKQPAAATEATSSTVVLTLPPTVLGPNVPAVVGGGILCTSPAPFTGCETIGTATTTSPLFPAPLTGNAYLTGSLATPAIALVFPPPFPITLSGAVDISTGATTFTGVPDLPLTDLQVVLAGGPDSVFTPSCNPASGTASSALTSQNGDQTATADAPFTVSNCPPPGSPPSGPGAGPGAPKPPPVIGPPTKVTRAGRPHLSSLSLRRTARHRLALGLSLVAGNHALGLKSVTVALPAGLRFARKHGHRLRLRRLVSSRGGTIASTKLVDGRVLIKLRHPARRVTIAIRGLTVPGLGVAARHHHRRRLAVRVSMRDAGGKVTRFPARTLVVRVG